MSDDFREIEGEEAAYTCCARYYPARGQLEIWPEFRRPWCISLRDFLSGLGITLRDCEAALADQEVRLKEEVAA